MTSSARRRVFAPPAYDEGLTPSQWRRGLSFGAWVMVAAIGLDVVIYLALRGDPRIDRTALDVFAGINIPTLAACAGIWSLLARQPSPHPKLFAGSLVLIALTLIVWIQVTGTLTSYFLISGILILGAFRLYWGYWLSAVFLMSLVVFHVGAVLLEGAGFLEPEALFTSPPAPLYEVAAYRAIALTSISSAYLLVFLIGSVVNNKLREKDLAIAEIRQDMDRVAKEVRHGRLTGTVLADQYALGELLGRGGMGEIYAARWLGNERNVAIKVLHAHLVHDEHILERFRRETRIAERVPAKYRAHIYDVGVDHLQDLHYIAMEHLRGEDFAAYLRRRGPLAPDELVPLARRIADAIDAAHAAGVVHRDLKPQNIFLVEEAGTGETGGASDIRLLDFGMSKIVDHATQTLTRADAIIGTVAYMAPEQAVGRTEDIGGPSDRFSFAAVLYRALTGRLPFQAADLVAAIRLLATSHPPPPSSLIPDLHRDIDAVMVIGLAKKIELRYPSARALVDDLEAASRGGLAVATRDRAQGMWSDMAEGETLTAGESA